MPVSIYVSQVIAAEPAALWEYVGPFDKLHAWNPAINTCTLEAGAHPQQASDPQAAGASGCASCQQCRQAERERERQRVRESACSCRDMVCSWQHPIQACTAEPGLQIGAVRELRADGGDGHLREPLLAYSGALPRPHCTYGMHVLEAGDASLLPGQPYGAVAG